MYLSEAKNWHFDIDRYINPYLPQNRIGRLPKPLSHFLGFRDSPRKQIGNLLVAAWAFLGAFIGVIVIVAVFKIPTIHNHGVPLIIASFGAAAILEFNAIESPLAQPRNTILGHTIAALVGISVTKLFTLDSNFEDLRWLAGAFACGLASAAMTVTKTIYPPAGATALLAAVDPTVQRLGWYLLPLVLLSAVLTLAVSLLINNIRRQYPTYWWTPAELGRDKKPDDIEKVQEREPSSQSTLNEKVSCPEDDAALTITITPHRIVLPDHLYLAQEEKGVLEILRDRLGGGLRPRPKASAQHSRTHGSKSRSEKSG